MRRDTVRELYQFRCGYCGVHENDAGALLTVDHFQPRSRGGTNDLDNLVYACHNCNEFKGDWWEPDSERRILHPLRDDLSVHVVEAIDHRLIPLTETGRFHLETLRLNRPPLIAHRRARFRNALNQEIAPRHEARFAAIETEIRLLRRLLGQEGE